MTVMDAVVNKGGQRAVAALEAEFASLQQTATRQETAARQAAEAWQEAAMRRLRAGGLPDRRSEAWRYTDLVGALEETLASSTESPPPYYSTKNTATENALRSSAKEDAAPSSMHKNRPRLSQSGVGQREGALRSSSLSTEAPSRVEILFPEKDAAEGVVLEAGGAPEPLFAEEQGAGVSADVNLALAREGFVLRVETGVVCPGVIHVLWRGSGHGRGRVELGAGASARILESHIGDGSLGLRTHLLECRLGEGALLRHGCVDAPGAGGVSLGRVRSELGAEAKLECGVLGVGGRLGRREYMCDFAAPGARVRLRALSLARGGELRDVQAEMNHRVGDCVSDTLVKSVLEDGAQGVFQGMVRVAAGASGSDGRQISKALLLGEAARMNAKPELEVFNDDVECAHGSAIGSLDAEALFYLRARGIGEAEARRMLVAAFFEDVLEGVEDGEALRARAREWLDADLSSGGAA